ncbi:MAG: hypothetical protein GOV01_03860, partial [Candidatus Altiarchaeota archaeon]|nr:hypothetical protein [Candidatus Altiarchaeota archaeon]
VSTRIVAISDVGEFEGTIESYIVGDLDVPYYVMSIPMSDVSFDAVLNSSDDVNTTSSLRGNKTVYNVYEGLVKDENILSLFTYFDGHLYQIGTDSVKRDLNAFNELFDYYFKKN